MHSKVHNFAFFKRKNNLQQFENQAFNKQDFAFARVDKQDIMLLICNWLEPEKIQALIVQIKEYSIIRGIECFRYLQMKQKCPQFSVCHASHLLLFVAALERIHDKVGYLGSDKTFLPLELDQQLLHFQAS